MTQSMNCVRMLPPLLPGAAALALSGCVATYADYPQAPAPLNERVPAPPHSEMAQSWRPGYYDWNGSRYAWTPGRWVAAAGHGTLWQDGYWRQTGTSSYAWVPPGWR